MSLHLNTGQLTSAGLDTHTPFALHELQEVSMILNISEVYDIMTSPAAVLHCQLKLHTF